MAKNKRKRGLIITLAIILVVVIVGGVVAYSQRNNIHAVLSMKYTEEERREKLTQQELAVLQKIADELPEAQVKPLTVEEEQLLKDGVISQEDALKIIMGEPVETFTQPEEPPSQPESSKSESPNPETPAAEPSGGETGGSEAAQPTQTQQASAPQEDTGKLKNLLAQVYLMKSNFTGQLDGLIEQAKQEYIAGKGKVSKYSIGKRYIGIASGLEAQCDARMDALLGEIKAELQRTGGDTGLVNEIRAVYESEKSAKKAALIEKYS